MYYIKTHFQYSSNSIFIFQKQWKNSLVLVMGSEAPKSQELALNRSAKEVVWYHTCVSYQLMTK